MLNHIDFFESVVGQANVIKDEMKKPWGNDHTKAFEPAPLAAVLPQSTEEVQRILQYCNKNELAVVPSGGRTGLAGGAVAANQEVVISTSRMRKIFGVNTIERTIHCQAGLVTKELQKASWDAGLYFPVDFASSGSSQIGGNVATNAGGIKVIRYGLIRDWVLGLQAVLADGTILRMDNACIKNNTGYDLKHLFIGSEGTLGIITEVLMKLTSQPKDLLLSLFGVETLEKVTWLFDLCQKMNLNLTAYEFFTDYGLRRVQEHTKLQSPFEKIYPYYVLVEIEKAVDKDEKTLEEFVQKALDDGLIMDGVMSQNSQQFKDFWGLRENISESLSALTVAHKNDICLPVSKITSFCSEFQKLVKLKYPGFELVLFGHIGDGNLHVNFTKPDKMTKEDFFKYTQGADTAMFDLVGKFGGSVSAEHGIGLMKKDFLHFTRSPAEISIMKQIKKVFDPNGIMNPGKVLI